MIGYILKTWEVRVPLPLLVYALFTYVALANLLQWVAYTKCSATRFNGFTDNHEVLYVSSEYGAAALLGFRGVDGDS